MPAGPARDTYRESYPALMPDGRALDFPTPLAAKLAISVQLSRPLGSLPEADRQFIDALLAETLDRNVVAARISEHFRTGGRADAR